MNEKAPKVRVISS